MDESEIIRKLLSNFNSWKYLSLRVRAEVCLEAKRVNGRDERLDTYKKEVFFKKTYNVGKSTILPLWCRAATPGRVRPV